MALKKIDRDFNKINMDVRIMAYLNGGEKSIVELVKLMNMKRTTLIHYLKLLEKESLISMNQIKKTKRGRPTMIKLNRKKIESHSNKFDKQAREMEKKYIKNPLTFKTLKTLVSNKDVSQIKILELLPSKDSTSSKISILNYLKAKNYIELTYRITLEGKEFLKQHSK